MLLLLQDGVHREMWSSDTAFQWKIPENPARHSRWVSPPLLYIALTSPLYFLSWKIITFEMRNFFSNSIMVISHLRSAGQLDRLCTLLFLTPEASCRGYGWIADGSIGLFLSLSLSLSFSNTLPSWWCWCCCRLELLGQEKTLLIFTLMPLCCSLQST